MKISLPLLHTFALLMSVNSIANGADINNHELDDISLSSDSPSNCKPGVELIMASPNPICFGTRTSVELKAFLTGTPPFRVKWSNGFTEEVESVSTQTVKVCGTKIFTVSVEDASGCQSAAEITVFEAKDSGRESENIEAMREKYCTRCHCQIHSSDTDSDTSDTFDS